MCESVTIVMCVSLALVASSALPAPHGALSTPSSTLHNHADCLHKCLLRTQVQEKPSDSSSSCNFKLFCDKLCKDLATPGTVVRPRLWRLRSRRSLRSPGWTEAALIARSVGMDVIADTSSAQTKAEPPSNLRVTSLSDQGETVDCQLTWDSTSEGRWYLVSWDTEAAGRGNLLTPSSPVTITLLPATLYHIQVSPSNLPEARVSLEVDTRHVKTPGDSLLTRRRVVPEDTAGVLAALLLFLFLVLLLVTRWRTLTKSAATVEVQSHSQCDHFKVYSPPVTIVPVHRVH